MPKLTTARIEAEPTPPLGKVKKLFDGDGLYLLLTPNGGRAWRLKYTFGGRETSLSLGLYPQTSLESAREQAAAARALLAQGRSPAAERRQAQQAVVDAKANTFGRLGLEYLQLRDDRAPRTAEKHRWLFELLAPIHRHPMTEITTGQLVQVLKRIEATGRREAAHRCAQFAARVYRYAIQTDRATLNPAAELRGALMPVITKSRAGITDPVQFGELMRYIDSDSYSFVTVRNGLRLLARTFVRPGELRGAMWAEFKDLDGPEPSWLIPASRMKMKRPHLVPLSHQAVAILKQQREISGHTPFVFPGQRSPRRPMSDAAMGAALKSLFFSSDLIVPHGFRVSASTLLNELGFDSQLIELQLSHRKGDKVAAIYDRSERLAERRVMMQRWSDYIEELKGRRR